MAVPHVGRSKQYQSSLLLCAPEVGRKAQRTVKAQETLLTVQEIADLLRVKPSWVYDHADDLGAFRLGKYLRFSLPRVLERLEGATPIDPSSGLQPNDLT
jgi:hypothetical protein